MTRVREFGNAFSSGEIDPLLHARTDFQRFKTGLAKCRGFVPLRQGGFTRAPGTIYRGTTRNNARCRRVPFEFSKNDALTLEFTDLKMRVWRYGALVESGGTPYELTTPFPESRLDDLQWVQDKDVIFITDGAGPIRKLSRYALDNWAFAEAVFDDGPFRVQNLDTGKTIRAGARTGTISLFGAGNPFSADLVGALIMLQPADWVNTEQWTPDSSVDVGALRLYDGRVYECTDAGSTGVTPPTHERGTMRFASGGGDVAWKYISDQKGIVRITAVGDANNATGEVLRTVPQSCVNTATYRWSEGAWSNRSGYPRCLAMFAQRLWVANTASDPRTVWASAIGSLQEFLPSIEDDGAFGYTIASAQTQNDIRWLFRGRHGIFFGAIGEIIVGFSNASDLPIGPTSFDTEIVSTDGAADAQPISAFGYPIYVTKGGTRLLEIRATLSEERGEPVELSLPSQHLGATGFAQIVWQSLPQKLAWIRSSSGDLIVMTYDPAQEVLGWAVVPLAGGVVEDMSVSPASDGMADILTLVVAREIGGQTYRYVEEQALTFGVLTGQTPISRAVHFFAATEFTPGSPTDTFSVPHLVGQQVHAWTDRGEYGPLTVASGGTVTLETPVSRAVIGLFDDSHHVETLDLDAPARDGSSRGRLRRLEGPVGIDLHITAAGTVAAVEREFGKPDHVRDPIDLLPRPVAQDLLAAFSGTAAVRDLFSGECGAVRLQFRPIGGAPMTVTGITPQMEEAGP